MKGKPLHIGFIAASNQFLECARKVTLNRELYISYSNTALDYAIDDGKRMENEGVEIIISRRATSNILRENLNIPVLSVQISLLDMLSYIKEACKCGHKILIPSFRHDLSEIENFKNFFGININVGEFYNTKSLEQTIVQGKNLGCDVVIGGGIAMDISKKIGMSCVELKTTEKVMSASLEDAISVGKSRRIDKEKTIKVQTIMNASTEGIISVDTNGIISTINHSALDLLKKSEQDIVGTSINTIFSENPVFTVFNTNQAVWDKLEKVHDEMFLVNYVPLNVENHLIGAVLAFKNTTNVMKMENKVRRSLVKRFKAKYTFNDLIYQSSEMKHTIIKAKKFANTDSSILIYGDTGTGKELLSQGIHSASNYSNGPFVSINCASVPDQLLESELFGYEEGAFTGSKKGGRPGLFELAHNGTIFLDEIGSTSLSLQNSLLRVLQEKEVMRVGGQNIIPINVRIISATNQSLIQKVRNGEFREDLFFRLNVLTINLPSLCHRIDDIPILIHDMVEKSSKAHNLSIIHIPSQYIERLKSLNWPGNVRQLNNFVEKLVILCDGNFSYHIFEELYNELIEYSNIQQSKNDSYHNNQNDIIKYENLEINNIINTLKKCKYSKSQTAKKLGISRTTLWRKLKNLNIQ